MTKNTEPIGFTEDAAEVALLASQNCNASKIGNNWIVYSFTEEDAAKDLKSLSKLLKLSLAETAGVCRMPFMSVAQQASVCKTLKIKGL